MLLLLLPLLMAPWDELPAKRLADFSGFSTALHQDVSLLGVDGTVIEGRLVAASTDGVTLRVTSGERFFARPTILGGERVHDDRWDGALKGALFGLVGILVKQTEVSTTTRERLAAPAVMAAVGYVIDWAHDNRQELYRAPAAPPPSIKISLRF